MEGDFGNGELKDEVLWYFGHHLVDGNGVFLLTHFIPLITVDFPNRNTLDGSRSDAFEFNLDIGCSLGDDSSEGITESLIEGAELVDEVEISIFDRADLGHQVLIVVVTEAEGVQTERSKIFVLGLFEHLPKHLFCVMGLLTIREQEDRGDLISGSSFPKHFDSHFQAIDHNVASAGAELVDDVE